MNRRSFLLGTATLASLASIGISERRSLASSHSVVDEALGGEYLKNVDEVSKISHLAHAFANVRVFYNGPFGYENGEKFKGHVFEWLGQAFYGGHSTVSQQTALVNKHLDGDLQKALRREMNERLEKNMEEFIGFLISIGVNMERSKSEKTNLGKDFLRAQSVFAVFASTTRYSSMSPSERREALEMDGGLLGFFDEFTGIWPLCKAPV